MKNTTKPTVQLFVSRDTLKLPQWNQGILYYFLTYNYYFALFFHNLAGVII